MGAVGCICSLEPLDDLRRGTVTQLAHDHEHQVVDVDITPDLDVPGEGRAADQLLGLEHPARQEQPRVGLLDHGHRSDVPHHDPTEGDLAEGAFINVHAHGRRGQKEVHAGKQVEDSCAACEPLPAWAKGWDFVLNEILPSLSERSAFAKEICAAVEEATMERAAGSGIAKAGPLRRQHAHRRCVREQLRSGAAVALRWLEAGGSEEHLRDGGTFTLPDRVEELFGPASRTSPLACKGDVRGRMPELMGEASPGRFRAPPPAHHFGSGYLGESGGCTSMPFVSDRLALPDSAAVVKLRPWLSGPTSEAWESPGTLDPESARKAYFAASHREWRKVVRRMVRCGLARSLPANTLPPRCAAGAFAVKKDEHADRLIGDRRPQCRRASTRSCSSSLRPSPAPDAAAMGGRNLDRQEGP